MLGLLALALFIRLLAALPQHQPNYMDEAYYVVTGANLAEGRGFVEDFVWNYLNHPGPPPRPSHLYWMPLTSLLASVGMLAGGPSYRAAQILFIILSALLAPLTFWLTWTLSGQRRPAWLAGLLIIFSGFYFPFWTAVDNFTPFALAGSLALLLAWRGMATADHRPLTADRGPETADRSITNYQLPISQSLNPGTTTKTGLPISQLPNLPIFPSPHLSLFLAGLCAGLAHLARADGLLILVAILSYYLLHLVQRDRPLTADRGPETGDPGYTPGRTRTGRTGRRPETEDRRPGTGKRAVTPVPNPTSHVSRFTFYVLRFTHHVLRSTPYALRLTLPLLLGYLLVMLPWFLRNWFVAGIPLSTAGSQTIWLPTGADLFTSYNSLFSYGRELSARTFLAQSWPVILQGRWWVLLTNVQTVIAVWSMIFLTPLIMVGGWQLRAHPLLQLAGWYALLLFMVMTLVFAFPGALGGLFHSGAALLPFLYAAAVIGLDHSIDWVAARRRTWRAKSAKQVFGTGLVIMAAGLSSFVYYPRVLKNNAWNNVDDLYPPIAAWIKANDSNATVMINNPPAYRYHGGGLSVVIPNEDIELTLAAARRYQVNYLVLEANHPEPLNALYRQTMTHPELLLVKTFGQNNDNEIYVYEILDP